MVKPYFTAFRKAGFKSMRLPIKIPLNSIVSFLKRFFLWNYKKFLFKKIWKHFLNSKNYIDLYTVFKSLSQLINPTVNFYIQII